MKIAYSYQRFSRAEQSTGDSIRRQQALVERFIDENGLILDKTLTDRGVSAYKGKNAREGALKAFLEGVESGEIPSDAWLICESLDRISRNNIKEALSLFLSLLNKGITIATLSPEETRVYDHTASEIDIITSLLIFSRANNESKIKGLRVKEAYKAKAALVKQWSMTESAKSGEPPVIITSEVPAWITVQWDDKKNRKGRFFLNEDKAKTVREIIDLYVSGMGFVALAKYLNKKSVPTLSRASHWHISYLSKILSNKALYGALEVHSNETVFSEKKQNYVRKRVSTGEVIEKYFPSLIDKRDFDYLQSLRETNRAKVGKKGDGFSNLFTSLCICGECGGSMTYINKGTKGGTQDGRGLVCSSAKNGSGCRYKSVPYKHLEEVFFSTFKDISISELLGEEAKELRHVNEARKKIASENGDILEKERQVENLLIAISEGVAVARVKEKISKLEGEIDQAKRKVKEMELGLSSVPDREKSKDLYFRLLEEMRKKNDDYEDRVSINNALRKYIYFIAFYPLDRFAIIKTKSGKDISFDYGMAEAGMAKRAWDKHLNNTLRIWRYTLPEVDHDS
ncbi:recombinase family protein [Alcanivorax sp. MM125-6]|nr:recombinase family protein [Alcanivorax sp. MM125-6]